MKLLTVSESAKLLKVHERTIRRHIASGAIEAKRVGGQWRIEETSLDSFMNKGGCCSKAGHIESDDFCIFMDSDYYSQSGQITSCQIYDFDSSVSEKWDEIELKLKALAYDVMDSGEKIKVDFARNENKLRVVLWAEPKEALKACALITEMYNK